MRRADKLYVPMVLKSGNLNLLETPGPVQACNWIALPFNCTVYVLPLSSFSHDLVLTFIFFYLPYLFLLNMLCLLHVLLLFPLTLRQVKGRCDAESRRHSTEATQARRDRKIQTHGRHQNLFEGEGTATNLLM